MSTDFNKEQKSPKRRFLLILGTAAFICIVIFGLMIIFWDRIPLQLQPYQRILFGVLIIGYGILRFSRLFKKDKYDEEEG